MMEMMMERFEVKRMKMKMRMKEKRRGQMKNFLSLRGIQSCIEEVLVSTQKKKRKKKRKEEEKEEKEKKIHQW